MFRVGVALEAIKPFGTCFDAELQAGQVPEVARMATRR